VWGGKVFIFQSDKAAVQKPSKIGLSVMLSTSAGRAPYTLNRSTQHGERVMLTKQGNTQVYSPFGSYVVEQHRPDCERPERCVPEPQTAEQPKDHSDSKEFQKAA
jgi:hypothetical protein